jgi:hypothetical protein
VFGDSSSPVRTMTLSFSGRTPRCRRGRGSSILPRVANHKWVSLSLQERLPRKQEAVGSKPATLTNSRVWPNGKAVSWHGFDPERPPTDWVLRGIKASRSSAGQSTRFRGERSQDRSLPRRPIRALTGDGAGPVLKTVSTATCGDRDLSVPPFQGRLTGQGPGAGWKPRGTPSVWASGAQSSAITEGQPGGSRAPVRSGMDGQPLGIKTSAFCHFSPRPAMSRRAV